MAVGENRSWKWGGAVGERKQGRWKKGEWKEGRGQEDVQAAGTSGTCVVSYDACRRTTQTRRMEGSV